MKSTCKKSLALILSGFLSVSVFASGYPVFDFTASMNAINQLYSMYDQINATIENVQNGYEQLQQAIEMTKGVFEGEMKFNEFGDDWWKNIGTARDNYRNMNKYISSKVDSLTAIKNKINNIKWYEIEGERFTTADLMGYGNAKMTLRDNNGNEVEGGKDLKKNFVTALASTIQFSKNKRDAVAAGYNGMSAEEREKVFRESGYSANTAHIAVQTSAITQSVLADIAEADASTYAADNSTAAEINAANGIIEAAQESGTDAARDDAKLQLQLQNLENSYEVKKSMNALVSVVGKGQLKQDLREEKEAIEKAETVLRQKREERQKNDANSYESFGL